MGSYSPVAKNPAAWLNQPRNLMLEEGGFWLTEDGQRIGMEDGVFVITPPPPPPPPPPPVPGRLKFDANTIWLLPSGDPVLSEDGQDHILLNLPEQTPDDADGLYLEDVDGNPYRATLAQLLTYLGG